MFMLSSEEHVWYGIELGYIESLLPVWPSRFSFHCMFTEVPHRNCDVVAPRSSSLILCDTIVYQSLACIISLCMYLVKTLLFDIMLEYLNIIN